MIITLQHEIDNASVQVGDVAFYSNLGSAATGPSDMLPTGSNTTYIGIINEINGDQIVINNPAVDPSDPWNSMDATQGQFLLFAKSYMVNSSRLKGYYATVTLRNDSMNPVELFAVSSEVTVSSK